MHHPLPPPLNPEPLMQTIADSSKKKKRKEKNLNALQRTTQKCQQLLNATDPIVVGDCPAPAVLSLMEEKKRGKLAIFTRYGER